MVEWGILINCWCGFFDAIYAALSKVGYDLAAVRYQAGYGIGVDVVLGEPFLVEAYHAGEIAAGRMARNEYFLGQAETTVHELIEKC